jgi:hypothetical protein
MDINPACKKRPITGSSATKLDRAIVMGGLIDGFAAARVLSDYISEVIPFKRFGFGRVSEHVAGVPQNRPAHELRASSRIFRKRLSPDLFQLLTYAGAVRAHHYSARTFALRRGSSESVNFHRPRQPRISSLAQPAARLGATSQWCLECLGVRSNAFCIHVSRYGH